MMGMKNKDLIMLGLVIGIGLFFVGAMISNVFPSNESDLIGYKVSSFIKMLGLGFVVSSMIVGGIIVHNIDKNLKMLLLLLGLILLIIYTIGAQQLHWDIESSNDQSSSEVAYDSRPTGYGVPGFDFGIIIVAGCSFILYSLVRKRLT